MNEMYPCMNRNARPNSFHKDAARLWNSVSPTVRTAPNLYAAKKEIDRFCKTLPIYKRKRK